MQLHFLIVLTNDKEIESRTAVYVFFCPGVAQYHMNTTNELKEHVLKCGS